MKKFFVLTALLMLACVQLFSQTTFTGKPTYQILTTRAGNYLGTINVELFPAIAPLHTANFDSLVNVQYYDSTAFHRVIPGFMIQGGDPNSRSGPISTWGYGDPNQPTVNAEFTVAKHVRGILSAARDADTNSATSQFFICVAPASWLNNQYSVYGRVTSGMNIVDTIVSEPRDVNDNPLLKIEMFITATGSNDTLATVPVLNAPANNSFGVSTTRVLNWDAQSDGIIYHVQVSSDSTFATTYRSIDVGIDQYAVTALTTGTKYYWRVKSNNGGDTSAYSQVWNFSVSGVGIESFEPIAPVQVAPNPSNGIFVFSDLPRECTLEIFDISGRSVLLAQPNATNYSLDLSGNAKGMYFCRVSENGKPVQQGKLIVD